MLARALIVGVTLSGVHVSTGAPPEALPLSGRLRHIEYDLQTGEWRFVDSRRPFTRGPTSIWASTLRSGYVLPATDYVVLEWGDIHDGARVDRFDFAYLASTKKPTADVDIVFYREENGFRSVRRSPIATFRLTGLPSLGPNECEFCDGFVVTVNLPEPFVLTGPDLDPNAFDPSDGFVPICGNGYGLTDFGYSFHFRAPGDPQAIVGPTLAWVDPNTVPCLAPGIRDYLDVYVPNPSNPPDPNHVWLPDVNADYFGTFNFGGMPFAQCYLELFGSVPGGGCPQPGCERADIDPPGGDCDVDLADLAVLLSNYGTISGATRDDGDIEPQGGDGDVDLADLAILLADFGTNCN